MPYRPQYCPTFCFSVRLPKSLGHRSSSGGTCSVRCRPQYCPTGFCSTSGKFKTSVELRRQMYGAVPTAVLFSWLISCSISGISGHQSSSSGRCTVPYREQYCPAGWKIRDNGKARAAGVAYGTDRSAAQLATFLPDAQEVKDIGRAHAAGLP